MKISRIPVEVRYAETDQMGVVHHSSYVVWCELGRTALIRELGFSYAQMEKDGVLAPVLNIDLHYKQTTTYGETVAVHTWIEAYDGLRVTYGYDIVNEKGETCVSGTSTHVCVKKETFRPISIRKHLPQWHEVYEREKKKM